MITLAEIRKLSRRIAREFNPDRIILFGSYAVGSPTEDSDVDLLVVMPYRGKSVRKACEILNRVSTTLPVDLLVRSPSEMRQRLAWNDYFLTDVVRHGRTLYEAAR
ncbi:MAG: nucleotidyltransferase domain-containing protein [Nitrospinae bacterium]|nr:nucleotidyltransferase domain-containing protein [Nitrospinota bacterium]